jgi:hypothetical protein
VDFTLEVTHLRGTPEGDWPIKFGFEPKAVRWHSDSVFVWPGPHELGGTFRGAITFEPILAGLHGFCAYMLGYEEGLLDVKWCLTEDGSVELLRKRDYKDVLSCSSQNWTYFRGDTITIREKTRPLYLNLFSYQMDITPPLHIGDTSLIRYHLLARRNIDHPMRIEITGRGIDVISNPEPIDVPVLQGDVIDWDLQVVPLAVRAVHELIVFFETEKVVTDTTFSTVVPVRAVFSNDSTLKLIGDHILTVDPQLLPMNLRLMDKGDNVKVLLRPGETSFKQRKF